jgi:hypothetical protein
VNCHREPCSGLRKSLAGCPDQPECRWLSIRCGVKQESYRRDGWKSDARPRLDPERPSKHHDATNKQRELSRILSFQAFDNVS